MQPGRGIILTLILTIGFLSQAASLIFLFNWAAFQFSYLEIPIWLWTYQFVLTLLTITSLIGIWLLKKWAVFLLAGIIIIYLAAELILIRPLQSQPVNLPAFIFAGLIVCGIWFWVILKNWGKFK